MSKVLTRHKNEEETQSRVDHWLFEHKKLEEIHKYWTFQVPVCTKKSN